MKENNETTKHKSSTMSSILYPNEPTTDIINDHPSRICMDELPLDIVFNIFSRIPLKSLFQFRCVSRPWCNIIDHPYLANMHIEQVGDEPTPILVFDPRLTKSTMTMSLYLLKEKGETLETSENPLLEFDLKGYCFTGSCNGLQYFTEGGDEGCVIVSNPLREEFQRLPSIEIQCPNLPRWKTYGLGFDISTNTFKMICVFFRELNFGGSSCYGLGTLVHTVGTNTWKEIDEVPTYPIYCTPVFAHGALHWLVDPFSDFDNFIVSFDVGKEKFDLIPYANLQSKDFRFFQLVDLNGDLGMTDLSYDTKIEIWVMKDYVPKKWVKEYILYIGAPCRRPDNRHFKVVGLWKNGGILLKSYEGYFIYNQETGLTWYSYNRVNSSVYIHRGGLISLSKYVVVSLLFFYIYVRYCDTGNNAAECVVVLDTNLH
ncbi:unnamed protein product [Ilex paraguariensis]|uniref:F-box domain-containing protein n=1 Tax=Ilex paraguariensis TaxID=185542 RepID=A0ABC8UTH6_9AQUA